MSCPEGKYPSKEVAAMARLFEAIDELRARLDALTGPLCPYAPKIETAEAIEELQVRFASSAGQARSMPSN